MTMIERAAVSRHVYFHDPDAPPASVVVPSVLVAARWLGGRLLLVRREGSDTWELPGGAVDVGETAVGAAVRRTAEEAGVQILVTGIAGLFTDAGHVVRSADGEVRQQFAVLFRARAIGGVPHGAPGAASDAAWVAPMDLGRLAVDLSARTQIDYALSIGDPPYIG